MLFLGPISSRMLHQQCEMIHIAEGLQQVVQDWEQVGGFHLAPDQK